MSFGDVRRLRLRSLSGLARRRKVPGGCALALAAGMVPDGGAATAVSVNHVGRSAVNLAPVKHRISHPIYRRLISVAQSLVRVHFKSKRSTPNTLFEAGAIRIPEGLKRCHA